MAGLPKAGVQLVAEGAAKYFGDLDRGTKAVTTFGKEAEKGARGLSKFEQIGIGALRQVGAAALDFGISASKAVVGFVGDSIAAGAKFESTMSGVRAALGPTEAEFEALRSKALQLGADTAFSATEAGEAIENLAKNGLSASQILNGAADATVYLAAATGTDLSNAANIATDAMADFGIKAEDMTTAINGISGVTVASKFGIDDYRLALAQAGGVAGSVGVSFKDFNTSIAAISPLFASGSDAGTSFKTFLQRLIPQSDKAADKMRELGLITEDGANQFFTASGAMKDMDQIAGILQGAFGDLTEQQKNEALATIFGTDAMRAAVGLANAGTTGFNKLADAIGKVDARQQAAERMNNFSGALEEAKGSLETLQIVIASKVLPFLTQLVRGAVTPAINAITTFAQGMDAAGSPIAAFGSFIANNAQPALIALGVATLAYAATQVPALIAATASAVAAFGAQAVAMAAALAPFALMAAAVFAVAKAYQGFSEQVKSATDQLLEGKTFWQESTAALEQFGNASTQTKEKLQPLADSIQMQRDLLHANIESLGKRQAAGLVSEAQFATEMEQLNGLATAIGFATKELNNQVEAEARTEAASLTATNAIEGQGEALDKMPPKIKLTAEELQKLAKEFEEIMRKGEQALGQLATTHAQFLTDMASRQGEHEEKIASLMAEKAAATTADQKKNIDQRIDQENKGYQQQLLNQAKAYAEQAKAQRQALGEQLLAYIENQRQMGNITDEKASEIRQKTIEHFGVMKDSAAALFGDMATAVDSFARDANASSDDVISKFGDLEGEATEVRAKMQELEDKYVAQIIADFTSGKITIEEAKRALASIPREVSSTVTITTVRREQDMRGDDPSQQSPGRALGGPVTAGRSYIVGERRPEVFVPETNGRIVPSIAEFDRRYSPPSRGGERGGMTNISSVTGPTYQWTVVNPQPQAVDSLAALVRVQQLLYA